MHFIPVIIVVGIPLWILRPQKGLSKTAKNAILPAIIPSLLWAVPTIIFPLVHNACGNSDLSNISNILFIIGLAIIIIAIILLAFLAFQRRDEIVRALSFGICIAVILCALELFPIGWLAGDF